VISVILAAGRGARLGGVAKALLAIEGDSFLARIARTLAAAGAGDALVVVGPPHDDAVAAEAARLGLPVVLNPAPERGMASSVSTGFAALADRPASADLIAIPTFSARGGHPSAFGRALWPELVACATLPAGALSVVHRDPARVRRIPVDDPGILADVDRPGDLEPAP